MLVERVAVRASLWGVVFGTLLGCSESGPGDSAQPTAREFFAAAAIGLCSDLESCCDTDGHPFDESRCRSNVVSEFEAVAASEAIAYDADAAGRCLDALEASPSTCGGTVDEFASCPRVFVGDRPAGSPCVFPQECAGYPLEAHCFAGTCIADSPTVFGKRGDPCGGTCRGSGTDTACSYLSGTDGICHTGTGLYCSPTSGTCEPVLAFGDPCPAAGIVSCVDGAFCDGSRCVPLLAEGGRCAIEEPCQACSRPDWLACRGFLVCSTTSGQPVCTARQPDGAVCNNFDDCESRWCETECSDGSCAESGVCGPPKRTTPETCSGVFGPEAAMSTAQSDRSPLGLRRSILARAR